MLSRSRQKRLEELRTKYPKQEPQPPIPEHHSAYLTISLHFDFQAYSQEEADRAVSDWAWQKGYDITNVLYNRYAKDGLRDITLIEEVRHTGPTKERVPDNDLYPLDIEDMRESDLQN